MIKGEKRELWDAMQDKGVAFFKPHVTLSPCFHARTHTDIQKQNGPQCLTGKRCMYIKLVFNQSNRNISPSLEKKKKNMDKRRSKGEKKVKYMWEEKNSTLFHEKMHSEHQHFICKRKSAISQVKKKNKCKEVPSLLRVKRGKERKVPSMRRCASATTKQTKKNVVLLHGA